MDILDRVGFSIGYVWSSVMTVYLQFEEAMFDGYMSGMMESGDLEMEFIPDEDDHD